METDSSLPAAAQSAGAEPSATLCEARPGTVVRVRRLCATPCMNQRLREMGFGEQQLVRLVVSSANLICQVCNARLALSRQLAALIQVEPVGSLSR